MKKQTRKLKNLKKLASVNSEFDFEEVYRENRSKILSYISARVTSLEDAEDIVEEVFIKVYKNLADFRWQGVSIGSWIYRIAKNSIIDYYRKNDKRKGSIDIDKVENVISSDHQDLLLNLIDNEAEQALYKAISKLNPNDQYLIYYKYFEDLSLEEIAVRMNMTETNVGTKLYRLRKRLAKYIKNENKLPSSKSKKQTSLKAGKKSS